MQQEKSFDFRRRLLEVHPKNIRDWTAKPSAQELVLKDKVAILIPGDADRVVLTAAKDFADFLFTSMGISAVLKYGSDAQENSFCLSLAEQADVDLGTANGKRGFRIDTSKSTVCIYGFDSRGIAQGLYYLEDVMTFRRAPYLPVGSLCRKPMYSPQMVHSGYKKGIYPDAHLAAIAHEGRDAVLLCVKEEMLPPDGCVDINDLVFRAAGYGIDVYIYSELKSDRHPDDPDAEAFYENTYGRLFKHCPGLKGVTLVGEAIEFPSKDPHVTGHHSRDNTIDGIPTGKTSPGWYPCEDYPQYLALLQKVIYKYNPEADIVFWTYNWGYQPEEARKKLIKSLPEGISMMATFEMFEPLELEGHTEYCADYTLAFEGYGKYFASEAQAAKERGIRLYSMTNTAGLTWDFGVIPYQPYPYQWMKRYRAMAQAQEKWGLCGLMECHDYGIYPSMISKLSKWAFLGEDMEETLEKIVTGSYGSAAPNVLRGLKLWSEGMPYYIPTDADQYGAFRVGPSYPFCLDKLTPLIDQPHSEAGNGICIHTYWTENTGRGALSAVRLPAEVRSLEKMRQYMLDGLAQMESAEEKNPALLELINLGQFLLRSITTGIHAKKWHMLKCKLLCLQDKESLSQVLDEMEALLRAERTNAEQTIPLVQKDSRLGYNTVMDYMTDETHLRWKLRQVDYVLNTELMLARRSWELS